MPKIVFISLLCFTLFAAAQPDQPPKDLAALLVERDGLYREYAHYSTQKSSFWGTQSKKDLRHVIDVLKGIVNKDTEIVEAVRVQGVRKESNYLGQSREITDRVYTLDEEVEKLNVRLGQQRRQLADAQQALVESENGRSRFQILSLGLGVAVVGLAFYLRRLR